MADCRLISQTNNISISDFVSSNSKVIRRLMGKLFVKRNLASLTQLSKKIRVNIYKL